MKNCVVTKYVFLVIRGPLQLQYIFAEKPLLLPPVLPDKTKCWLICGSLLLHTTRYAFPPGLVAADAARFGFASSFGETRTDGDGFGPPNKRDTPLTNSV